MVNERFSIVPFSRRRLTKDWRILAVDNEENTQSKCTTRRKTFQDEIWLESIVDLQNLVHNSLKFVTGSSYEGECSKTGMEGYGRFTFLHGVIFEGHFRDGMFHGDGILIYPQGQSMKCTYHKGRMIKWEFLFEPPKKDSSDEDFYYPEKQMFAQESWYSMNEKKEEEIHVKAETYCKPPDRRFLSSHSEGQEGAPKENLTNIKPTRKIPEGCYDVGDGFYNPKTKWVHRAGDMETFLYMVPENDRKVRLWTEKSRRQFVENIPVVPIYKSEKWIKERCRKAWDENVGYKPGLYEYWFSGMDRVREKLNMGYESEGGNFVDEKSSNEECLEYFRSAPENLVRSSSRVNKDL